ncbi:hypothetical protein AMTR_s00036p00144630 [Amborella trichopoda]|uniref:Uncharacterized protein n=1 Tax=Amborella trichopoda TaxID=13333 RepID=U5CQ96_AMBTC|nr:hypothetical protein AMTR_s00036p00144630 [Amborella trichopoda]
MGLCACRAHSHRASSPPPPPRPPDPPQKHEDPPPLARKLAISLSRKLSFGRKKEGEDEGGGGDLIWKKTIILGERCKVPSSDDEESIIYDDKGNRIETYRPRTPRSLTLSRSNSAFDDEKTKDS